jgi:hypothetical protein
MEGEDPPKCAASTRDLCRFCAALGLHQAGEEYDGAKAGAGDLSEKRATGHASFANEFAVMIPGQSRNVRDLTLAHHNRAWVAT